MNLPFFKGFKKKVPPLYFLVLILRDRKAQAVILEKLGNTARIIGQKEEYFSTSIDILPEEKLLEKLDKAISSAESSLPENIQTQKTIFGVKESWTDNDQIKKEHLVKLKKTSEELGLIPIGFLVISQAISHLLQKEEGAPVSAILVEVNEKNITVTLLRAGKNIETKSSEIHESIPFTVDTLLKHFDVPEILPSRIIIFNGKEDLSQEFISHAWSKSLPFLHLPQITSLPQGFDTKSVLFGAATQMGFAITPISSQIRDSTVTRQKEDEVQKEVEIQNFGDADEALVSSMGTSVSSEPIELGFIENVDVAKMPPSRSSFPQNEDKKIQKSTEKIKEEQDTIPQISSKEIYKTPEVQDGSNNLLAFAKTIPIVVFGTIFSVAQKINPKRIPFFFPSGKLGIIIPGILILIIALIASYFLLLKATITITVDPKITQQDKSVLFSTTKTTDPNKNIIQGEFVSVSEDGSVSTPATGKKDVGTTAKGSVVIFNSLTQSKTLAQGTILEAPNGLEFTLDSSVTIKAVASHSADETVNPEKATVNVTANQLGKESNLPSGTKFSVGSFDISDLIAKNDDPFSGGTKKEVTVASQDDSAKLEEDLLGKLEEKAKEDLQKQLDQDKILLPAFITKTLGKKSLNVKIGDETNQVTLTGTVNYQGISYDKNDLIAFSKSLLSKDVSPNQEVDYNNIKTSVLDIKDKNDEEIEANLNIKALLVPKISENKLINDLKGKSFETAQDYLYKLPQIANVMIKFSPNLPFLPKNLPVREKNIKILITIDG